MSARPRLPLVYVAGPITRPNPMHNTRDAVLASNALRASGLMLPIVPHLSVLADMIDPRPYDWYLDYDLALLNHVHALYRLAGESEGADAEVQYAHEIGLPVFHQLPPPGTFNVGWSDLMDFCAAWEVEW